MLKFTTQKKGKIGLLVPRSSFLPTANDDFVSGIQLYMTLQSQQIDDTNCEFIIEDIGGASTTSTKEKAEKLLLSDRVDVILALISFRVAEDLYPLFERAGKLLLIANMGGHMPADSAKVPFMFSNTLHTWQHTYSFGQWAAINIKGAAFIFTSLYDSGFDHSRAFHLGHAEAGGQVVATHITHVHQEKQPLEPYFEITDWDALDWVYANYLGDKTIHFLESIKRFKPDTKIALSPLATIVKATEAIADWKTVFHSPGIWPLASPGSVAEEFIQQALKYLEKYPSPFTLLGYECGKLVTDLFTLAYLEKADYNAQRNYLLSFTMESPRGQIKMSSSTQNVEAPLLWREMKVSNNGFEVIQAGPLDQVDENNPHLIELRNQSKSAWLHPYGF